MSYESIKTKNKTLKWFLNYRFRFNLFTAIKLNIAKKALQNAKKIIRNAALKMGDNFFKIFSEHIVIIFFILERCGMKFYDDCLTITRRMNASVVFHADVNVFVCMYMYIAYVLVLCEHTDEFSSYKQMLLEQTHVRMSHVACMELYINVYKVVNIYYIFNVFVSSGAPLMLMYTKKNHC